MGSNHPSHCDLVPISSSLSLLTFGCISQALDAKTVKWDDVDDSLVKSTDDGLSEKDRKECFDSAINFLAEITQDPTNYKDIRPGEIWWFCDRPSRVKKLEEELGTKVITFAEQLGLSDEDFKTVYSRQWKSKIEQGVYPFDKFKIAPLHSTFCVTVKMEAGSDYGIDTGAPFFSKRNGINVTIHPPGKRRSRKNPFSILSSTLSKFYGHTLQYLHLRAMTQQFLETHESDHAVRCNPVPVPEAHVPVITNAVIESTTVSSPPTCSTTSRPTISSSTASDRVGEILPSPQQQAADYSVPAMNAEAEQTAVGDDVNFPNPNPEALPLSTVLEFLENFKNRGQFDKQSISQAKHCARALFSVLLEHQELDTNKNKGDIVELGPRKGGKQSMWMCVRKGTVKDNASPRTYRRTEQMIGEYARLSLAHLPDEETQEVMSKACAEVSGQPLFKYDRRKRRLLVVDPEHQQQLLQIGNISSPSISRHDTQQQDRYAQSNNVDARMNNNNERFVVRQASNEIQNISTKASEASNKRHTVVLVDPRTAYPPLSAGTPSNPLVTCR